MTKNQKMLLGIGAIAVVGYLLWKKQSASFSGGVQSPRMKNSTGCSSCNKSNASGAKIATSTDWGCKNAIKNPNCGTTPCYRKLKIGGEHACACFNDRTGVEYDCFTPTQPW